MAEPLAGRRLALQGSGCGATAASMPPSSNTVAAGSSESARRDDGELARLRISVERAFARGAPRVRGPRARSATARGRGTPRSVGRRLLAEVAGERGAAGVGRIALAQDRHRRVLEPGDVEPGEGERPARRARPDMATHALALGRSSVGRRASRTDVMASSSSGWKSSSRQRERIVGSSRPGAWLTSRKMRVRRRLLEILEQRVGACRLEIVDAVDDDDAPRRQRRASVERTRACRGPGRR